MSIYKCKMKFLLIKKISVIMLMYIICFHATVYSSNIYSDISSKERIIENLIERTEKSDNPYYDIKGGALNDLSENIHKRISEAVDKIWLIDSHEHFTTEAGRRAMEVDFFNLVIGYLQGDLVSSGMSNEELQIMLDKKRRDAERWKIFETYWKNVRNTGYGQCLLTAVQGLFGIDDINEKTFPEINRRMKETNHMKDWYQRALKDKSKIDVSIIDPLGAFSHPDTVYDSRFFVKVRRFDNFVIINTASIINFEKHYSRKISSLDDFLGILDETFENAVNKEGIVGIKSGLAYIRILRYDEVTQNEAEVIFSKLLQTQKLTHDENKKLEDFLMHQVIARAENYNLPIQIHTGILSRNFNSNPIGNTNAVHMHNLFLKFRNAKFVIFHGSFPYMNELSYLAKHFPNVYIDMSWMHIISPAASKQYLEEWLVTVPSNKIMAFGGDASIEWTYGHSVMARKAVTQVLTKLVNDGYFTVDDAVEIAERVLRTNALDLFMIEKIDGNWRRRKM